MLNEFLLYAVIAGAVIYGVACLLTKDKAISWVISIVAGLAVIYFFFPDPKSAKTIGDIANNFTLLIQKAVYLAGWGVGSFVVSLICKR